MSDCICVPNGPLCKATCPSCREEAPCLADLTAGHEYPPGICPDCGHPWADHHERDGCGVCAMNYTRSCKQWPLLTVDSPTDVTDADRTKAAEIMRAAVTQRNSDALADAIAAALALERAAVARPVLALAEELDTKADVLNVLGEGNGRISELIDIADRLRAVVAAAPGEPGGGQ